MTSAVSVIVDKQKILSSVMKTKTDKMASNYALKTRSGAEDPIFGNYLEQLPFNKLPNLTEIYRNYLFRRESEIDRLYQRNGKIIKSLDESTKNKIVHQIIENLKQIWWNGASIPVRDDQITFTELKKKLTIEAPKFSKSLSTAKKMGKDEFLKSKGYDRIFDISKCRYFEFENQFVSIFYWVLSKTKNSNQTAKPSCFHGN